MNENFKRARSTPTGATPKQEPKRSAIPTLSSRRQLASSFPDIESDQASSEKIQLEMN